MKVLGEAAVCAVCLVLDGLLGTPVLGQAPYARRKR